MSSSKYISPPDNITDISFAGRAAVQEAYSNLSGWIDENVDSLTDNLKTELKNEAKQIAAEQEIFINEIDDIANNLAKDLNDELAKILVRGTVLDAAAADAATKAIDTYMDAREKRLKKLGQDILKHSGKLAGRMSGLPVFK